MAFNSIDGHGPRNRHQRRIVSAIQRAEGKDVRKAAAEARRAHRKARNLSRDLGKTIVFYALPANGVGLRDPDGAYLGKEIDGRFQVVVAGPLKAEAQHYARAVSAFLNRPLRITAEGPLELPLGTERPFLSLTLEPGEQ